MHDADPETTFGHVAKQMNRFELAYLHVIEPRIKGTELIREGQEPFAAKHLRQIFDGPIIAAGGFTKDAAEKILAAGDADLVAFGRAFISNPDLPERLKNDLPLAPYDRDTFYGGDEKGYTDYPAYELA
jgi:N-ethylmaleimide reductase